MDPATLEQLIQTLPRPTVAIDAGERIVAMNAQAGALIGQGMKGRHFVTALRQPALVEAVEQCLTDSTARRASFHTGETQQQTTYEVHVQRMASGGTVILSFEDVTHMAQAVQMRRDFVANVSHELRTPLTSMMGFIETLQGAAREDATARDRFLDIMSGEAGRMNRLVGDLLSLSRVEEEERVRPTQRLELGAVLRSTLRTLEPVAQEQRVRVTTDFATAPLHVLGDADQLVQVFTNLVENGIKYGGPDRALDVTLTRVDYEPSLRAAAAHVAVRDYGPGIAEQHIPRLTERFYRADSHRSRALGGTGLGLAIVKHILNRHRGRLRITSTPGQGSCFTVILPLAVEMEN